MTQIINEQQKTQLLVYKKCLQCNGDSRLDVEFDKETLEFKAVIICDKCKLFYPFKYQCNSEEELEYLCMQVAKSTIKDKGFVKVKA